MASLCALISNQVIIDMLGYGNKLIKYGTLQLILL